MSFHLPAHWPARALGPLRAKLLAWFDANKRDLPWRATTDGARDPYHVWVSEIMLQQTTVAAVVPKFAAFVKRFPTLAALAAAPERDVLKQWEGLGYYRRARHLHAAAIELTRAHGGELPNDPAVWAALPGVGRYVLGAVLSQAFDRRLPIVEANSLRVLSRLFGSRTDPRAGEGKVWVWGAAEAVLPQKRCGDFNQALMELGALVCTPTNPECAKCPLAHRCEAKRLNLQHAIPPKAARPEITTVREVGAVVRDGARVLVCQRPATATRWQNMWEVPHAPLAEGEEVSAGAARVVRELTGFDAAPGAELLTIRHGVTRYAITLVCVEAELRGGAFAPGAYAEAAWVRPNELADYPTSSPQRKLMTALAAPRQKRLF
jgi:A/G-specific adenine glycosylase